MKTDRTSTGNPQVCDSHFCLSTARHITLEAIVEKSFQDPSCSKKTDSLSNADTDKTC